MPLRCLQAKDTFYLYSLQERVQGIGIEANTVITKKVIPVSQYINKKQGKYKALHRNSQISKQASVFHDQHRVSTMR